MSEELIARLHVHEVDPHELAVILIDGYPRAEGGGPDVLLFAADGRVAMTLRYGTRGDDPRTLIGIEPGDAFDPSVFDATARRVESDILGDHGTAICRQIVLTRRPVTGAWRHNDDLQLFPVPTDAVRPEWQEYSTGQPALVEVRIRNSPEGKVLWARQEQRHTQVRLLLQLFIDDGLIPYREGRLLWTTRGFADDQPESRMERYSFGGLRPGYFGAFTDLAPFEEIVRVPHHEYFAHHRVVGPLRPFDLPDTLDDLFDRVEALEPGRRTSFLEACHWYEHAMTVLQESLSAHFVALITAIEALLPNESGRPCPECKKPTGPGPTAQFRDFVEEHLPGEYSKTQRQELYALRSRLVHGRVLHAEFLGGWPLALHPATGQEYGLAFPAASATRRALLHWLTGWDT
jgi:Apea-like HEPN